METVTGHGCPACLIVQRSTPLRSLPAMASKYFDKTSSCKAVNSNGRAYQYQAIELIKICRLFSTASHQSPDQDIRLQRYCAVIAPDYDFLNSLMFLSVCSWLAIRPLSVLSTHARGSLHPQTRDLTTRFASYMSMRRTSTISE